MRYIYTLSDPKTLEVRYIGQTNNINRRFNDHLSSSVNENNYSYHTHKSNWIRKVLMSGDKPIIDIIDECETLEESNYLEKYYIEKYTNDGYKLTNSHVSDVTEFSIETRKKMSEAKLGKSLEEIHGTEKAKELKEKFIKRVTKYNLGRPKSKKTKYKISETLKEYFSNSENHWAYGKKMSDEHNEKLRLAKIDNPKNVGNKKPRTEEVKDKIRKKILGSEIKRYKILQYDLDMNFLKEWNSLREIERNEPTLKRDQISKCCKGLKGYYGGYIWIYKIED
jgi:hypothetical protein